MQVNHVLVCADDFGLHPAVDAAVIELAAHRRLSGASCLVEGSSFADGAATLAASGLQSGLHLNFTERLGPEGIYMPLGQLIRACWTRRLSPTAVRDQIARQLDRYEEVMGREPDYVDGHQHVHQFPQIREVLLQELGRRYSSGGARPWLRCTIAPRQPGVPVGAKLKASVIALLGAHQFQRDLRRNGFLSNRALRGVYDFRGGRSAYAGLLQQWLSAAREGDLIMCHPATQVMPGDVLGAQRLAELSVWKSDEVGEWLHQYHVRPAPADYLRRRLNRQEASFRPGPGTAA